MHNPEKLFFYTFIYFSNPIRFLALMARANLGNKGKALKANHSLENHLFVGSKGFGVSPPSLASSVLHIIQNNWFWKLTLCFISNFAVGCKDRKPHASLKTFDFLSCHWWTCAKGRHALCNAFGTGFQHALAKTRKHHWLHIYPHQNVGKPAWETGG